MLIYSRPTRTRVVYRNGIAFQVPISNHSTYRFTVHPDGSGTGWDEAAPDIDQPHGLDYRSLQDLRKGFRKRLAKEHRTCGDVTVGGEHLPGGCRVLGIVETTADLTAGAGDAAIDVTDGKFIGRGIIYDQTNNVLWCWTNSDGTTINSPYQLTFHPDRAWAGGDVTWAGAHEFDASVDMTGPLSIKKDLTVDGTTVLTGTFLDGTTTFNAVAGENGPTFKIFGDWSARSNAASYLARTDGLVHAISQVNTSMELDSDTNDPPTTMRGYQSAIGALKQTSLICAIKGGNYWEVSGADVVLWLPFADNS